MLTSDGTWETHISVVTNKASRTLRLLRRTLKIDAKSVKEQAYKSIVRLVFEYACSMWDPHNVKHIKSLEAIKWRAARWTLHRYRRTSNANDMLTALDSPSLQSRRRRARLSNFYKFHHRLIAINNKYTSTQQATVRRPRWTNPLSYPVPYSPTDYREYSNFPNTIIDWNSLPEDVVTAPNPRILPVPTILSSTLGLH